MTPDEMFEQWEAGERLYYQAISTVNSVAELEALELKRDEEVGALFDGIPVPARLRLLADVVEQDPDIPQYADYEDLLTYIAVLLCEYVEKRSPTTSLVWAIQKKLEDQEP